ncbi:uncharacterized protein LOC123909543 [Trifolium pratense]|uniref:uncharacterized protein LOC123909543 n=1 Tax=Trifolium pratense TaxID=57577 RepID=UPI001E6941A5|nr:uncharacterized protein LOC123909543 [Trifolium pratense]
MEELLMDPAFHVTGTKHTPNVSEFSLVTPNDLGVQADMSNDCGVWVIMWMKQMGEKEYKIDVDDGTRLRIALDLILDPSNELKEKALAAAKKKNFGWCKKKKS